MTPEDLPGGRWFVQAHSVRELMRAVAETFARLGDAGEKPAAECWTIADERFAEIRPRIVARWAELTGFETYEFPWRDDFVKWAWLTYRKSSGDRGEVMRWCGLLDPVQPPLFDVT